MDNLPVLLLQSFAAGVESAGTTAQSSAVVVDVRDRNFQKEFPGILRELRSRKALGARVIFLEATDETLVRRFSETRRPHPLAPDRSVVEGIVEERKRLSGIRDAADYVFDTSNLTVHELRRAFRELFEQDGTRTGMLVTLLSFGFKHGLGIGVESAFERLLDLRVCSGIGIFSDFWRRLLMVHHEFWC